MAKAQFRGTFNHGKYGLDIGLSLLIWEEEGITFVYAPSLDLTGYGPSEEEAKESFEITLQEFFSYTNNKDTIYEELESLGWTVNRKKKRVHAPSEDQLLEDNDTFKSLYNNPHVRKENKDVKLALA